MGIRFGTDGWRARIAEDYTFENVRRVARAAALFWKSPERKKLPCYSWKPGTYACTWRPAENGMVVGYDARFLSEDFALQAAKIIGAHGIPVQLSKSLSPTPTVSFAAAARKLSGGIMITASHNPYRWNGFKIKMEFGGSALPEITRGVENQLKTLEKEKPPSPAGSNPPLQEIDLIPDYFEVLRKKVNLPEIEKQGFKIIADPMFGTNAGLLKKLLPKADILEIHGVRNPLFPGLNPEPTEANLRELTAAVMKEKADAGLAFDGDGDRIGAVDEKGNFLSSHEIFCLLLWHLAGNKKWSGAVAKTFSTTNRVKLLAEYFKLPFHETPIGFKYICELFLSRDILIGGEESGGIGVKNHIPERDSLLNALFLLELMSASGKKLGEILDEIHREIGCFYTDRIDMPLPPGQKENLLSRLTAKVPERFGGFKTADVSTLDGVKYLLEKGTWILFRPSGTEPLIRIYAEAESRQAAARLLEAGKNLVEDAVRAPAGSTAAKN